MKDIYLTIDDCPTADFRNKVDFLSAKGIPAILFCVGCQMEERPDDIVYAIKKGFIIGNHSYDHPKFSTIPLEMGDAQITRTDRIIEVLYKQAGTKRPIKVFRFPHGDRGTEATRTGFQSVLRKVGYKQPVFDRITYGSYLDAKMPYYLDTYWTYDSRDYTVARYRQMGDDSPYGFSSPSLIFERIQADATEQGKGLRFAGSNDIFLIHDNVLTADLFVDVINRLAQMDVRFKLPFFSQT